MSKLYLGGWFDWDCRERGKLKWKQRFKNGVTTVGINNILAAGFTGGTPSALWYLGFIDALSYASPGVAVGDTMASHTNWIECTAYAESVRQTWSKTLTNALVTNANSVASFTMNAAKTLKGMFLANESTKGGVTGILFCTGLDEQTVASGQVVTAAYSCTGVGA